MNRSGEMNRIERPNANHMFFFDMVRNLAMLSVVLFHAAGAYSTVTPYWPVHDGSSVIADGIRELFEVFMMPIFFFLAGYFALPSLYKQGTRRFLIGKFRRLGVPWLLALFVIIPMTLYFTRVKANPNLVHQSFWQYWMTYLSDFGTFRIGLPSVDKTNQMHFWFLSLLLTFFLVFVLFYVVRGKLPASSNSLTVREPGSKKSILKVLLLAGLLVSADYFVVTLMTPNMSWVTVDLLWQFEPGGLVLYIVCFALGGFAYSRQWFVGDRFPDHLSILVPIGLLLTAAFFLVGRDVFAHPSDSNLLPLGLLLAFAVVRTLLCLTFLVVFVAYARTYWNRPSVFNQKLAANSYNIYLVHLFFVIPFQEMLMIWPGGPAMAKMAIVFLLVLPISYGISRLIDRFPRVFVAGFIVLFILVAIVTR
ncbi:MAG: acyltransferase family protein [Thermodesulfobacteriota bacterium]